MCAGLAHSGGPPCTASAWLIGRSRTTALRRGLLRPLEVTRARSQGEPCGNATPHRGQVCAPGGGNGLPQPGQCVANRVPQWAELPVRFDLAAAITALLHELMKLFMELRSVDSHRRPRIVAVVARRPWCPLRLTLFPLRLSLSEEIIYASAKRREGPVWYLHAYRPTAPIFSSALQARRHMRVRQ